MKKALSFLFAAVFMTRLLVAAPANLVMAPGTLTDKSVCLLWDKQVIDDTTVYEIVINGKVYPATGKTNCVLTGLLPGKKYTARLRAAGTAIPAATLSFKTNTRSRIYNILDYGARNDTTFLNTRSIQAAIDACSKGGTVYIPAGTYVTGALFLKSNMTLYVAKGGILKGSTNVADYEPMFLNRFEGWELKTYASLLNAGTLNRNGSYNVTNLHITGEGTIAGGGKKLGDAMTKTSGFRTRGRLLCLLNGQDICISNLTITEPPSWTLHFIYSNRITCHNLTINTIGIFNGDGIDPDSSTDFYVFNCTFDTGDDCIAIKSGKNPEGFFVAKPTRNVRITDCDFRRGHGISIGSEMSGGISEVLVQDCKAGALWHGMQIKGTKDRGGYVKNVRVVNCQLLQITVFTALGYNNDGQPAPQLPVFENFRFENIDLSAAGNREPVIDLNGFKDPAHRLKNVTFSNIKLPEGARISVNDAAAIRFINVRSVDGNKPTYLLANSEGIEQD